jgi:glutamate synthase domain-containing protein 3
VVAKFVVGAHRRGWRRVIAFDVRGQRFLGCGLGADSQGFRLDAYGSPGDYLGSGLDGAEVRVHANGQDQLGQIMKAGKLVVFGDLGQTFMYAAKGGEVYVKGNTAGRPLINAVGKPRVVINGTCLDYLAESFMAGDPLKGGGFVVLNGIRVRDDGAVEELETPYPGGNLFSLASGGAIYIRDPRRRMGADQLNGGMFDAVSDEDWDLIRPYLEENERLFGSMVKDLLTVDGVRRPPHIVFRHGTAVPLATRKITRLSRVSPSVPCALVRRSG